MKVHYHKADREIGIVLKRFFPTRSTVSIFTNSRGKIEIYSSRCEQLWPGMQVAFFCESFWGKAFAVESVEVLTAPLEKSEGYLCWLHHILEICYYFFPLHDPSSEAFFSLQNTIRALGWLSDDEALSFFVKKLGVMKLLLYCGFYPREPLFSYLTLFDQVVMSSLDFQKKRAVESLRFVMERDCLTYLNRVNAWTKRCLERHPCKKNFKTMSFAYRLA